MSTTAGTARRTAGLGRMAAVVVGVFLLADRLTLAGLGEDFATSVGMNYRRIVLVGTGHGPLVLHLAVLAVWGLLSWAATVRLFRWS